MAVEQSWTDSSGKISCTAKATIDQYEQVKVTGNRLVQPAGSGEHAVGVALTAATATGKDVDVLLYNHGGSCPGIIAASTTAGAKVYTFTGGLLKPTTTAASGVECTLGICLSGATVTGSRIEFIPCGPRATT